MIMYSDNSDYDDQSKENEINLYSQLYFEAETQPNIHLKSNSNTNSNDSIDATVKNCDTLNIENKTQNRKSIPNNNKKRSKLLLYSKETSNEANSKNSHSTLEAKSGNIFKKRHLDTKGNMEVRIRPHIKWIRKSSICNLNNISGKEPLDSLYCDGVSDNQINLNINAEDQYVPYKRKKLSQAAIDEEVTILPTSVPVAPTLEIIDDSSNESIKIVGFKKKDNSLVEPQKDKFQFEAYSSSESDEFNLDLSHQKSSAYLHLDFDTNSSVLHNGLRFQDKNPEFIKSLAIFSKGRPLSERCPTCPKWTPDMTSLYDSDYFDEFSVEDVHRTQTDSPSYWRICKDDAAFRRILKRKRYYQRRCRRCKEEDHEVEDCPRVIHCLFCASPSHNKFKCPKYCCFKCGKKPHKYCFLTSKEICECCKSNGHDSNVCPDLWRRYHITVAGSVPIAPTNISATNKHPSYCYNCSRKGHYGHQCPEQNFKSYTPVTTLIHSYCNPNSTKFSKTSNKSVKKMKRSFSTSKQHLKIIAGNQNEGLNQIMKASGTTITTITKKKHSQLIVEGPIENVKVAFQLISKEFSKTGKTLKIPPSFKDPAFDSSIPLVIFPSSLSKETKIIKKFPLALPLKTEQALKAISIILEPFQPSYSLNNKLFTLQKKVMDYFQTCDMSNPQSTHGFSRFIHLLATVTNRNSKPLKYITQDLWKIKKALQVYGNDKLDPALYHEASSIYASMIDPPSQTILKMLFSLNK